MSIIEQVKESIRAKQFDNRHPDSEWGQGWNDALEAVLERIAALEGES